MIPPSDAGDGRKPIRIQRKRTKGWRHERLIAEHDALKTAHTRVDNLS